MILVRALLIGLISLLAVAEVFGATPAQDQIQPRHTEGSQAPVSRDEIQAPRTAEYNDEAGAVRIGEVNDQRKTPWIGKWDGGNSQRPRVAEINEDKSGIPGGRIAEVNDDRQIQAPRVTLKAGDDLQATPRI